MNIRAGDYVLYKGQTMRVTEVDIIGNSILLYDNKKKEIIIGKHHLIQPLTRGQTFTGETSEKFIDTCLDKINILCYNKRKNKIKELEDLMVLTSVLKGK